MKLLQLASICTAAFTSLIAAVALPVEQIEERDTACTNGALTRSCWTNGYSVATDFDQKFPTTGNTVTYNLEITNTTCNPDGHGSRTCLLINGRFPGPLIRATWGDMVVINVKNSMQDNGTSIHWHGVRQFNSCGDDGVNGLTECPLAPGDTKTYRFQATQFGSSWYHSHYSSQYGDGIVGPMIFDGPATSNYDIDLGPYALSDWYYPTAFQINSLASQAVQLGGPPPNADNILINGTNKNANGGGSYNKVTMQAGKKYRLRLINMSVDNYIRVSLDNHTMQVMTTDFVPVRPFTVQTLLIGIGQRYDVVISANQTAGNYWFRANVATDCLSANNFYGRAIWSYSTVASGTPSSTAWTEPSTCLEPQAAAPYWVQPVPSGSFNSGSKGLSVAFSKAQVVPGGDTITVWTLGSTSMNIAWEKPTLQYVMDGNSSYPASLDVLPTTSEGSWNYWVVQQGPNMPPIPHPIHLHGKQLFITYFPYSPQVGGSKLMMLLGHDYFVLGQGTGTWSSSSTLNWATPIRRDTATIPGGGWLAIAFASNNPGAWLMHCHIAWHVSEGLSVQFLEEPSKIKMPDASEFAKTCSIYNAYYKKSYWKKDDSGL